jgi:leucyl aminopeptidase (aminopeptidase T)
MIWGMEASLRTLAACPPSARLRAQCQRALSMLESARRLHARSPSGTDFTVELGDPKAYPRSFIGELPVRPGMIGAPLCASLTAPFVFGTAQGTLSFNGVGRFQGPENRPLWADDPVRMAVEAGRVARVDGESAAAIALADWFARAGVEDGTIVMDCNIGFDPRAEIRWADNTVVHSFAGGLMIGFGNPYEYRPEGSRRPGYHLDLMFPELDVDLDDIPFIRDGRFTPQSGVV